VCTVDIQRAHWISSEHTQRVHSVERYCKEVRQYCTTEHCSTGTHLLLLCSTTCITSAPWTRKMPSRSPSHARRRPKREAKDREPAAAGHEDRCAILAAGAAVSPPGPQRIIAQMICDYGIQTDRSQHCHGHYVVLAVLQYEYAEESSLFLMLTEYPVCTMGFVCSLDVT
jgi:hypothetical protein